jgi:hypothetical protein
MEVPQHCDSMGGCLVSLGRPADAVPLLTRLLALQDNSTNRIALGPRQCARSLCVLLLCHNDLAGVIVRAEEATKRDPYAHQFAQDPQAFAVLNRATEAVLPFLPPKALTAKR